MSLIVDTASEHIHRAGVILRDLGYGVHESQVILSLCQVDVATVSDLSNATKIHHANLYAVLSSLEDKGIVIGSEGRPKVFQLAPLSHLKDSLTTKVSQLIKDMKIIQSERRSQELVPTLIYTIRGRDDVEAKILSMLSKVKERAIIVSPNVELLGDAIFRSILNAAERNVTVKMILGEKPEHLKLNAEIRIKEETHAIDLVVDCLESLISMPDLSVCGYADNELISLQLEEFLEQTWNLAKVVNND
jgi:sugar-specific transcriptional regulator TrmB